MAELNYQEKPREELDHALTLMRQAMEVLDENHAPADVGAHLDQAINRLKQVISDPSAS
jgi:hypothetical protein